MMTMAKIEIIGLSSEEADRINAYRTQAEAHTQIGKALMGILQLSNRVLSEKIEKESSWLLETIVSELFSRGAGNDVM